MRYPSLDSNRGSVPHRLALVAALMAVAMVPAISHAQSTDAGAITTGDAEADALIADIERVTADVVEVLEEVRSDRLDPEALLDTVGREPDAILEWVASETRWLPYEGALRGASGVLMDRSGSSLDRALLLADLLERTGLEVRLANTSLPEATASSLAASELERPWSPDAAPVFADESEIEDHRVSVASAAEELASAAGLLADTVAGGPEPADVIADHWWVQASSEEQWDDYDPLFADGAEARPSAVRTIDPADLPEQLRHTVTLRVVIERYEDGALIEEVPLEHTVPMGEDKPYRSIDLDFAATVPPELTDQASETNDVIEVVSMAAWWRPRLRVDGQIVAGEWFSEAGRIEPPGAFSAADAMSDAVDGLGGLGSAPVEEGAADPSLSATWIEYVTAGPGIEPRIERREILDLVGASRDAIDEIDDAALVGHDADMRRGFAFLGGSTILLVGAATHPDAYFDALFENWIELRPALIALAFLRAGVEDERIDASLAAPEPRPLDLLAMTSARDRWATSRAAYVGRPQAWSRHLFYDPQHEGNAASVAVDIVLNDIDVIPSADTDPRLLRLEQGILDTLVEHVLSMSPEGLNTWDRFARRGAEGVDWTVIGPGTGPEPGLTDLLPPNDLARMGAALARGDTVVVAAEPRLNGDVPFAEWWRISDDGTALGIGYRGWGAETTERGTIETQRINVGSEEFQRKLRGDAMGREIDDWLARMKQAQENMRARGQMQNYDPYAHLRHLQRADPFEDTVPIIEALADTLPFLYTMSGGILS